MRSRAGFSLPWGVVAMLAAATADAGSSLRSEGHGYYAGTIGYNWADELWDEDGNRQPSTCRSTYESFSHYAEWGRSYYHTLFGQVGLAHAACGQDAETGVSDLKLGIRGRINRYLNDRAWELELTIPTRDGGAGGSSVSCGAFELAANAERQHDDVTPWLSLSYGASLRLADAPLVHSWRTKLGASGRIAPRWKWRLGVDHALPLTERDSSDPANELPDCGTDSTSLRGATEIKFQYSKDVTLSCGGSMTFWGEDTRIYRGVYCGYARAWE